MNKDPLSLMDVDDLTLMFQDSIVAEIYEYKLHDKSRDRRNERSAQAVRYYHFLIMKILQELTRVIIFHHIKSEMEQKLQAQRLCKLGF